MSRRVPSIPSWVELDGVGTHHLLPQRWDLAEFLHLEMGSNSSQISSAIKNSIWEALRSTRRNSMPGFPSPAPNPSLPPKKEIQLALKTSLSCRNKVDKRKRTHENYHRQTFRLQIRTFRRLFFLGNLLSDPHNSPEMDIKVTCWWPSSGITIIGVLLALGCTYSQSSTLVTTMSLLENISESELCIYI